MDHKSRTTFYLLAKHLTKTQILYFEQFNLKQKVEILK